MVAQEAIVDAAGLGPQGKSRKDLACRHRPYSKGHPSRDPGCSRFQVIKSSHVRTENSQPSGKAERRPIAASR